MSHSDEQMAQPVHFRFGGEMQLTDSEGTEMAVRVMAISGRSALLEYRVLDAWHEGRAPNNLDGPMPARC